MGGVDGERGGVERAACGGEATSEGEGRGRRGPSRSMYRAALGLAAGQAGDFRPLSAAQILRVTWPIHGNSTNGGPFLPLVCSLLNLCCRPLASSPARGARASPDGALVVHTWTIGNGRWVRMYGVILLYFVCSPSC